MFLISCYFRQLAHHMQICLKNIQTKTTCTILSSTFISNSLQQTEFPFFFTFLYKIYVFLFRSLKIRFSSLYSHCANLSCPIIRNADFLPKTIFQILKHSNAINLFFFSYPKNVSTTLIYLLIL